MGCLLVYLREGRKEGGVPTCLSEGMKEGRELKVGYKRRRKKTRERRKLKCGIYATK